MGFKRVIAASIALALIVAGLSLYLAFTHLTSLARARAWVAHTHAVIESTQSLFSSVQDSETGERGFLITEDPRYLAPNVRATEAIPQAEAELTRLVADDLDQTARVKGLNQAIDRRQAIISRIVAVARQGDFQTARVMVLGDQGRATMEDIRSRVIAIRGFEGTLLQRRTAEADQQERLTLAIAMVLSLVALTGLTAGASLLAGANRRLTRAMDQAQRAQVAREASDALSRALFTNAPDYFFVLNIEPDDRFVLADINPAFEKALRTSAERVRGRALTELLPGVAGERLISHYRRVRAADRPITTRDVIPGLPDGPRTWESIIAPVKNAEGVTDRIIGSVRDITDRVRSDERLRDSQRMEAVGQLTGGVAHDFNNLLQVIRGNLELLEDAVASDERASARLKNAIHGADRAAQLTRQLLAFARRQPLEPQVINLSRVVSDMADLLRRTLGEAIEVETVVAGGLWNTIADPAQVESAILNLALNARDAMPEGGRLTVEITNAVLDDEYARQARDVTAGQYVLLAISDTGEGMSEETKTKVFEPFFTTKAAGKGTGLGLSMVYGFVKQSSGHIQIYSEVGHGTTVKIYLPRSRQAVAAQAEDDDAGALDGHSRVILVVEDETAVRAAALATLAELGYRWLEAPDAETALRLIEDGGRIDLVFTDVVMPGPLRTREFAERVRALRPGLPILFTSGYTENAIVHHGRLDEGVNLISKPYAKADLARKLGQLLARRPTAAT
ncbi:MAG: CHASE3 domain-containing protein [Caulobacterales bacterium]